jgi:hypothetical protein
MVVATRHVPVRQGDTLLLVGTTKGLFLLRSEGASRRRWDLGGPHFPGQDVYAAAFDARQDRHRLWASDHGHFGALLRFSDDFGRTWSPPGACVLKFPEASEMSLRQIWQIRPGRSDETETLYCGVDPAALFESRDGGGSWKLVQGLHDHSHRPHWAPGGGGLCLHTILPDASDRRRMYVGISTGGVYRTDDGGRSWHARNRGIRADFLPDHHPEFGQCVHKFVQHPSRPERLFLQNHGGIYRSEDFAQSWQDIGKGVVSDFGFCMAIHPHDPDTLFVLPLESDAFRCTPGGRLRPYRSRDAGRSWRPLTDGLPQKDALETILRDALAIDTHDPAGVYFGTRSGRIYASRDEGKSWKLLRGGLPPVVCVKAVVVGGPRPPRRARRVSPPAKHRRATAPGSRRAAPRKS